jgi:hypothetical protein
MSTHNLTEATNVYYGRGNNRFTRRANNASRGIPICFLTRSSLGSPAASDDDLLIDDATSTNLPNNGTKTYTPANNGVAPCNNASIPAAATITTNTGATASVWTLDAARNLIFATSTAAAATVFTITGYDIYMAKMVEQVTIGLGDSTGAGKKAFKYVESIAIYSAGNITTDTVKVGTGDVLGLPYVLTGTGDFIQASLAGVREATHPTVVKADATSPATATTGDVRGTIDLNSACDGGAVVAYYHVTAPSTEAGLVGITQYDG